ncbi:regulator of G-protein signaling 22-like [Watersipora subatra]|uniref:regulator of G-protein signaling 22-like n=1 Tax=Watersipora subatra TaxID=2589382 RepID=UPI00355B722B
MSEYIRAVDLNEDTLEDLLTYDDLFLDYFNAFLQLPAFAEPLEYDRLVGTFQEVITVPAEPTTPVPPTSALSRSPFGSRSGKRYGVSDEERESMLEWCKNNRLPYFLETKLFRELKLLKLLLRALDERFQRSASHKSSQIRGYSRQTESYVSSLSNSADNSANEDEYDEGWNGDSRDVYTEGQPGSHTVSLPAQLGHARSAKSAKHRRQTGKQTNQTKKVIFSRKGKSSDTETGDEDNNAIIGAVRQMTFTSTDAQAGIQEEGSGFFSSNGKYGYPRSISAPVNYKEFLHIPMYTDFGDIFINDDLVGGTEEDKFVTYNEDKASEQQTESDIKNLEGKINMSLQQMKERIFSSRAGMAELTEFLADTNGMDLFNFWIDCETFKDTMADHDEIMKMASRNQLFRDIQDKYKLSLTADARAQIQKAASSYQLSHTVFIRTQYDVLRRLRTYWLPRFILHKEKANELNSLLGLHQLNVASQQTSTDKRSDQFLPKISFVNSLPIDHNRIMQLAESGSETWTTVLQGGRKLDARVKSARIIQSVSQSEGRGDIRERMLLALQCDRNAGGPFRAYLAKFEKCTLLSKLLFWEAVTDYGSAEDRSADRLLRMNQAWNIYNLYIGENSPYDIDISGRARSDILNCLKKSTDFVSADLLQSAQSHAVDSLIEPWKLYLKYDVKLFLDAQAARFGTIDVRPSFALEKIFVICDPESSRVLIKKPLMRLRQPTASSVTTMVLRRTPLTQSAKEERRQRRKERRLQLLKEQKALLKMVKARQEERKQRIVDLNAKSRQSGQVALGPDGVPIDDFGDGMFARSGKSHKSGFSRETPTKDEQKSARINAVLHDKEADFVDMVKNRTMMTMFKKYLVDNEARDFINAVNLYHEIDVYHKTESKPKTKKDLQATFIYKTYLEANAKKAVKLNNEKVKSRLATEKDRPKTATFNEAQKALVVLINPMFRQFFEAQAEEFGVEPRVLATMSQAELAMRSSDTDMGMTRGRKGGRQRKTGRAPPSKEDKLSLMHSLQGSLLNGKPTVQMDAFYKYLIKHGEEDNSPLIDKDLMFYLEVQKYKELSHNFNDEELVKKKCQAIVDCFLESSIQPSCQIDISAEMCSRMVKNAVKVMQGKETMANLFDEAQFIVFKEILPYWAGFMKTYKPPEDPTKKTLSKRQKVVQKRYEEFVNATPPTEDRLSLPVIKHAAVHTTKISSLTYSITDGLKVKDESEDAKSDDDAEAGGEAKARGPQQQLKMLANRRRTSGLSSLQSTSKADMSSAVPA